MRLFAISVFEYIRRQVERYADNVASSGKLMIMMPSLPPTVVLDIGSQLCSFCIARPNTSVPLIKVAVPLTQEWLANDDPANQEAACEVSDKGWYDDKENLTSYRNLIQEDGLLLVVLLIGVDRITDASSMADFHHCDLQTIWEDELSCSFEKWTRVILDSKRIGYENETLQRFNWVLQPLVERGLADVLQISTLLQGLDLDPAQDGRDAEKILLTNLRCFGLPKFGDFKFSTPRAFGVCLDKALSFFSYDAFLEDRKRDKALKTIDSFVSTNVLNDVIDPAERPSYSNSETFLHGLREYIKTGASLHRSHLLQCDFPTISAKILDFRESKGPKKPEQKERVRKLSGGPIEVVLTALWITLAEFKRTSEKRNVLAHETLTRIEIESRLFKHDSYGESSDERRNNAIRYLGRLLGGVDRLIEKYLQNSQLCLEGCHVRSQLVRPEVDCQSARTAEPYVQFTVSVWGEELDAPVIKQFAWRLPETQPYRVADELIQWAAKSVSGKEGYCLPTFHVPYYEELLRAKDDGETRRVLLHSIREEGGGVCNLLAARDVDPNDPMLSKLNKLAFDYDHFLQTAKTKGLHAALLDDWDNVRRAYEQACEAYLSDPACDSSPLATLLFRAFLIVSKRESAEADRWMWEPHEPSGVVTLLHPALLETFQAHISYLLTSFTAVAADEIAAPGSRSFRDLVWQGYIDLAAIQMPLSGLIRDRNRVLDTDVRGEHLIHRIGSASNAEASLTTRLLLRYDSFDEDDISDAELFRQSRESLLFCRILTDYRKLHPHAEDGLSIAVYQSEEIQPIIAAVDAYLKDVFKNRSESMKEYAMSVTILTESSDDSSVSHWVAQWKERWEAAETQSSLWYYRLTRPSIAHRIVSPENDYRQFVQLVSSGLEVDIAFLNGFIRAGTQGNDFELVEPYDVTTRTLKFPILEKPFCAFRDPAFRLQRARVLSNRQFRLTTYHAELMARLKSRETAQNSHHVVLGFGDYKPWQGVVDALHQRAEWVVCIDPNIDERLLAEKRRDAQERREIIGFGSGVGSHGEDNFTISTEQFLLSDIHYKLESSIREVYSGWPTDTYKVVAQGVLAETRHLSGLSLVRATGIGHYVRDFMSYALTRKLLQASSNVLCDQIVSLDAYQHWFDSAESGVRPDLLWLIARIGNDGRLSLDMRLIECKLAKMSDAHLHKAREQLESGIRHLSSVFMPRVEGEGVEDERPDQRYWWLQLYRLIASKSEIKQQDQKRVLTGLERLAEGEFDITWYAAAITFWTDQNSAEITQSDIWPYSVGAKELDIGVFSAGTEFVRLLCETDKVIEMPWDFRHLAFHAVGSNSHILMEDEDNESNSKGAVNKSPLDEELPLERPRPANLSRTCSETPKEPREEAPHPPRVPDRIFLGTTSAGARKVYWEFGHQELNNRHMLIFGSSGMGKTYAIQCLLFELGRKDQNSLIVDYTNGFFDNQLEAEFKQALSPIQHIVRKQPLAINPFRQQAESIGGELLPEGPSSTAQRVSGVFSEVYNLGDQQKSAMYQAVKTGLEQAGDTGITLEDLIPRLELLVEEKGTQAQSASSVISKIRPFVDQNPFGAEKPQSWERLFTDAAHHCHIVQLVGFMKDAARLITEFSLIDLYWYYRGRGTQIMPRVVALDEVQNLDHREESPLAQLLREGRKFGFSLILATQIMSNLGRDERDRLFLAAHKLFFHPADTEMRSYAEIASIIDGEKVDVWMNRLAGLKKGECYSLGPSLNEATGKLEVKAFKIRITSLGERINNACC